MSYKWDKWDKRFLELAQTISQWSKDPSTKVGAVITREKRIVSLGYNGFAMGVNDDLARYADRDFKLPAIIHAEENSIIFAKQDLKGCSIYTWPMPPCAGCAAKIIQTGIWRVVSIKPTRERDERWGKSLDIAIQMYNDAGTTTQFYCEERLWK